MPFLMAGSCHLCRALIQCAAQGDATMQCNALLRFSFICSAVLSVIHWKDLYTWLHCTAVLCEGSRERRGVVCGAISISPGYKICPSPPLPTSSPLEGSIFWKRTFWKISRYVPSQFPPEDLMLHLSFLFILSPKTVSSFHQTLFQCHFNFPCKKICHTEAAKFQI